MSSVPHIPFDSYVPKIAIVTGGAQGIGYAIVHRLADDGFDVAINDIPTKRKELDTVTEEVRKKGRRAIAVPGDVSSESDVVALVETTVYELGGVDVMVANAGIILAGEFLELPVEKLDATLAVNVRGVFLCLKHAALQMVKQGRSGRLIAASSVMGKQGGPQISAYSASKFAVRGLIQSASIDLRKYGITANAYAPGVIRSAMIVNMQLFQAKGFLEAQATADEVSSASRPFAEPEIVASLVSYLAKPESYFVNGQSIIVDGGSYHFD
ncbi:NAD-binding protein [Fomitiporia mediterranea MF3/22]|uniref:NAD-binding protein n=1 Tax=Fomitiporia mediterranea (strain MF3/22) TaxID=694068 RepID=R7SGE6_FOMME|nr:NAD-binding protein [Fomitiporia mediterranea MF3/22]EJC97510.1 NAD-binding protein [Fomitiporia mediterranea MF3/22]